MLFLALSSLPTLAHAQLSGNCSGDFFSNTSSSIQCGSSSITVTAHTSVSHSANHPFCSQDFTTQVVAVPSLSGCSDSNTTTHSYTGSGTSNSASKSCSNFFYYTTYYAGGIHTWAGENSITPTAVAPAITRLRLASLPYLAAPWTVKRGIMRRARVRTVVHWSSIRVDVGTT
jgi:hypothetical protein